MKTRSKEKTDVQLINGTFSGQEAREILLSLINHKINFHEVKSFSNEIRFGFKDKFSEERMTELRNTRNELAEFLQEVIDSGDELVISSVINIERKKGR